MFERATEEITDILRSAGWFPGRHADMRQIDELAGLWDFQLDPIWRSVVSNLNGLTLLSPTHSWLKFDAIAASRWLNNDDMRFLRPLVQEPAFPLGEMSCAIFLGTASGRVIGLDNDWLLMYAAAGLGAFFGGILLGKRGLIEARRLPLDQIPEGRG